MKSGYREADINKKFINFAIKKKRKSILKKKNKNKQSIQKYRFVTNFEPSFSDIGFRKFKRILEDDEELMEEFPHGVKHFQVTQKRGCENMKEILVPSTVKLSHEQPNNSTTIETNNGSHPCGKACLYCYVLGKSDTDTFKSTSNGQSFKIRQKIDRQSQNIMYLITCKICNIQEVGHTSKFSSRISNYFSHIEQNKRTCSTVNHFIDNHYDTWNINYAANDIISIIGIAKITNLPSDPKLKEKRLWKFEGYWQAKLSIKPFGTNDINGLQQCRKKYGTRF